MAQKRSKRQQAIRRRRIFLTVCSLALVSVIAILAFSISAIMKGGNGDDKDKGKTSSVEEVSSIVIPETFATVLSTGDIMVHSPQLDGAKTADGGYDFSAFFKETAPYFKQADLAIGNMEVTFGGRESGIYSGYPAFNTPDSLADVMKEAGLNLLLTANNHSYDTGLFGLKRTAQVLKEKGIEFTGTKETETDPTYVIKEINDIKIGIANFTYETSGGLANRKYLNGMLLAEEATNLVNSFSYNKIDAFYQNAESIITDMKLNGAEFVVFYVHWGDEYRTTENTWQNNIAQKLSNLGVNIIVGSHPHVIQPIEMIYSEDGQTETICLYSTGNYISNQRQEIMVPECPTGHTEDGMLFYFTLKKDEDGVSLNSIDLIPTWVNRYRGGSGLQYTTYPLENPNDGADKYKLDSVAAGKAQRSYERTKAIVGEGLTACQQAIGCEVTFKDLIKTDTTVTSE